jgi:hypothetical protein
LGEESIGAASLNLFAFYYLTRRQCLLSLLLWRFLTPPYQRCWTVRQLQRASVQVLSV